MISAVLVDTGPLVALRDEDDSQHAQCVETLKILPRPIFTCWPVLTEAAYLLRRFPAEVRQLLASADGEFLSILPIRRSDILAINAILERYEDQGFQLADAALMHLAERERISAVFTLDRKDFGVYRTAGGKRLDIFPIEF